MNKTPGYDEVQEYTGSRSLPKGGYICTIVKLEEAVSKNGNDMIKVYLDIAEGDYKGIYSEKYKAQADPMTAKWKCIHYITVLDTTTKKTSSRFKTFITSVEKSNAGFVVANCWGDNFAKFFKGKNVGVIFGDEWFVKDDGTPERYAKPRFICSVETIRKGDFKIPDDDKSQLNGASAFDSFAKASPVEDVAFEDDLPF